MKPTMLLFILFLIIVFGVIILATYNYFDMWLSQKKKEISKNEKGVGAVGTGIGVLAVMLFLFLPLLSFETVETGYKGIFTQWNEPTGKVAGAGIYWVNPFSTNIEEIEVMQQKEEVEAGAASKDMQTVTAKVAINYHLDEGRVLEVFKKYRLDYKARIIAPAIPEAIKAGTAKYTAEELITKREGVKEVIKEQLRARLVTEGIIVDDVFITDFDFSDQFNKSVEAKATAEQDALTSKNKLEQVKFEAQQQIEKAKAEAETIRIQAEAINKQGGKDFVSLKAIEKWNGALPNNFIPGSALPFVNIDTSK